VLRAARVQLPAGGPMIAGAARIRVTRHLSAKGSLVACPCGNEFRPRRSDRIYCSQHCKDALYNRAHPVARQRALPLTPPPAPVPPVRDKRVRVADRKRLVGHNLAILERLRQGPATNAELAALLGPASAWRTRVSDVRLWVERHEGWTVVASQVGGGLWSYSLESIR